MGSFHHSQMKYLYHSALSWAPTSSRTRMLYEHEMVNETKLLYAVGTTWDACIRIFAVGEHAQVAVFSQTGVLIAARGYYLVKIFDTITGANPATFHERTQINCIIFSPDDHFLATGISGGTLNVWDVQTGTLFRTFKSDAQKVYSVSFSPHGDMIAAGGNDGTIQIWNILSSGCNYKSRHHSKGVNSVCWLGEERVMSGSNDRTVRIWDVQQAHGSSTYARYTTPVLNVASSGSSILVASIDGILKIYDSQTGDIIHSILLKGLSRCRLSLDGAKILVASSSNSGFIWDLTRLGSGRLRYVISW